MQVIGSRASHSRENKRLCLTKLPSAVQAIGHGGYLMEYEEPRTKFRQRERLQSSTVWLSPIFRTIPEPDDEPSGVYSI